MSSILKTFSVFVASYSSKFILINSNITSHMNVTLSTAKWNSLINGQIFCDFKIRNYLLSIINDKNYIEQEKIKQPAF